MPCRRAALRWRPGCPRSSPIRGHSNCRPTDDDRGPALKAAPTDQLRLLDLQSIDTKLDQLAHRRAALPEHAELARIEAELTRNRDLLIAAKTEHSDVERELAKAGSDVDQVRMRAARNQQRLDSGQVTSAKDLQNLQHEVGSLAKRQSDLEDVQLEIMERLEEIEARVSELSTEHDTLDASRAEVVARRDKAWAEIDAEVATIGTMRGVLAGLITAPLVELYTKIRAQQGGIGAAPLAQRRCQGCRLELNTTDINRIRDAAEDEVLRCEECQRILVRTEDSGL
jgi:predicted  nucleic acid-binding Zn-ribbon protein